MLNKVRTNLFVVSHFGQLSQVEAFIEFKKLVDNVLIVVYTERNTEMPRLIKERYNHNKFKEVDFLLLPNFPNKIRLKQLLNMQKQYRTLINNVKPINLYVLSFEGHYNLLLDYAKSKQISRFLLEEGTATYKLDNVLKKMGKKELLSQFLIRYLPFFKDLKPVLMRYKNFDKLYVSFPELAKERFEINEVEYFFAYHHLDNSILLQKYVDKYQITSNDFIYVNQRYSIDNEVFVSSVLAILMEFNKCFHSKIFIKMHPKDSKELIEEFQNQIQELKVGQSISLIRESTFLIESIISTVKIRGVIGLTSTVLVYAPMVSSKTTTYSIVPLFLKNISNNENRKGIEILYEHFEILKNFKHIKIIDNIDQLKKTTL